MRNLRVLIACEVSGEVREAFAALYPDWEIWSADLYGPDLLLDEKPPKETHFPDGGCIREHPHVAGKGFHYQGDVRDLFRWDHPVNKERLWQSMNRGMGYATDDDTPLWDINIAHPPCTELSYAGARFFKLKDARRGGDGRMQRAADFFMEMLNAPSPLIAVENPHSIIQEEQWAGPPTQVVQPWFFGDKYEKQIHLWVKGLPWLWADNPVDPTMRVTTGGGSWRTDKAAAKKAMSAYEDSKGRKNRARMRSKTLPGFARAMAEQWGTFAEIYYAEQR